MAAWNFATLFEICADKVPDAPALIHGDRTTTWGDFDRRADGVARTLLDAGAQQQDKVAQYLYNGPEYLESMYACFKAGLVVDGFEEPAFPKDGNAKNAFSWAKRPGIPAAVVVRVRGRDA